MIHYYFLDLLVVGVGAPTELQYINKDLYKDLRSKGIGLELLPTVSISFLSVHKSHHRNATSY